VCAMFCRAILIGTVVSQPKRICASVVLLSLIIKDGNLLCCDDLEWHIFRSYFSENRTGGLRFHVSGRV
jgi:hypothetical protein